MINNSERGLSYNGKKVLANRSLQYVEIKCQQEATEVFIADLIACSTWFGHHYAHHQELKSIIQRLLPMVLVFRAVVFKLLVWCGAEGYVSGLQDAAANYCVLDYPPKYNIQTEVFKNWKIC